MKSGGNGRKEISQGGLKQPLFKFPKRKRGGGHVVWCGVDMSNDATVYRSNKCKLCTVDSSV